MEETLNPVADIKYKCAMQEQLKTVHDTRISVAFSYSVNCIYINYLIQNLENFPVPIYAIIIDNILSDLKFPEFTLPISILRTFRFNCKTHSSDIFFWRQKWIFVIIQGLQRARSRNMIKRSFYLWNYITCTMLLFQKFAINLTNIWSKNR